MDTKKLVNVKTTVKARGYLRMLAALRGQSMQETAEEIFKDELKKDMGPVGVEMANPAPRQK